MFVLIHSSSRNYAFENFQVTGEANVLSTGTRYKGTFPTIEEARKAADYYNEQMANFGKIYIAEIKEKIGRDT